MTGQKTFDIIASVPFKKPNRNSLKACFSHQVGCYTPVIIGNHGRPPDPQQRAWGAVNLQSL